jgi:CheY-like chemotaxis protein
LRRMRQEDIPLPVVLTKPVTPSTLLDACQSAMSAGVQRLSANIAPHSQLVNEMQSQLRGAHVLLAEDNEINQELAIELLQRVGLLVSVANNGQEALDMIERTDFDCVLMDCQMPDLDGYTATQRLRSQARFADLPVIAMTANAMLGDREKALACGMNDHAAKPIDVENLYRTLARWILPRRQAAAQAAQPSALPGIDVHLGLQRTLGNQGTYNKLLKIFWERERGFTAQLRHAMNASDDDTVKRLLHTMENMGDTLGAHAIARACHELQASGGAAIPDGPAWRALEAAMTEVLDGIGQAFGFNHHEA